MMNSSTNTDGRRLNVTFHVTWCSEEDDWLETNEKEIILSKNSQV